MISIARLHHADCSCPLCVADRMAPSPLEIAIACAKIRARWSRQERLSRIVDDATRRRERGWRPPMIEGSAVLERVALVD